jgi:hypothetical protein
VKKHLVKVMSVLIVKAKIVSLSHFLLARKFHAKVMTVSQNQQELSLQRQQELRNQKLEQSQILLVKKLQSKVDQMRKTQRLFLANP